MVLKDVAHLKKHELEEVQEVPEPTVKDGEGEDVFIGDNDYKDTLKWLLTVCANGAG